MHVSPLVTPGTGRPRRPCRAVRAGGWSAALLTIGFASLAAGADVKSTPESPPDQPLPQASSSEIVFEPSVPEIAGRYERAQLVVTAVGPAGERSDITRDVSYSVQPEGIVEIDSSGRITPRATGTVQITATDAAGRRASRELVARVSASDTPGFHRHVMPLLSKHSCNTCHGKPGGQNGFQLSLFGYDPASDYRAIVQQSRGRRISTPLPARSLLLRKPTGAIAHGGGIRFQEDSLSYATLRGWIAAAAPIEPDGRARVESIAIHPSARHLSFEQPQQIGVIARYDDGTQRDVTHLAQYRADETELAEVDAHGLVTPGGRSGQFAIVVNFRGHVGTFRGTIPFDAPMRDFPKPRNFIDEAVFAKLKELGLPPAERCDDPTFLRRVTIDVAGRLPTLEEVEAFRRDDSPGRRDRVIDRLLDSEGYASYFANKWLHLLRNRRIASQQRRGSFSFHHWIRENLRTNRPYNEFVRDIVAASGDMSHHPPATWYRDLTEPTAQVENMSQLFLGVRITCARCHHHPFEKWSQRDYFSLAAFFSQVDRKYSLNGTFRDYERRIYHRRGAAQIKHPTTGEVLRPAVLDGEPLEIGPDVDPRQRLVDWMESPDNPYFATVLVNRYWKHFFGRGIVDPEDDLRETNPPSNPELLEALRQSFIQSGFDLKQLVRTICRSRTYQLSSRGTEANLADRQNFSRFYPRRLNAEVIYDAIDSVAGTTTKFRGMPERVRCVELPDTGSDDEFLTLFGKPKGETSCGCERIQAGDLRQSLFLLTSAKLNGKLAASSARPAGFAKKTPESESDRQQIEELYLRAFSRKPTEAERETALRHVRDHEDRAAAYRDLFWVVINTKEFLYNH